VAIAAAAALTFLVFVYTIFRKVDIPRAFRTLRQKRSLTSVSPQNIAPALAAWIGTYALFLLFWGPLIYFRASYTPALALGLGLLLARYHRVTGAKPSGAAALAVAAVALSNLAFYIGPNMRTNANVMVAAAENADGEWDEHTVILFADRNEADTAFEYFNQGTRWKRLTRASALKLHDEVASVHSQGGEVWLNRGAIELVGDESLESYEISNEIAVDAPNAPARYVQVQPVQ
jgi:hypothetical protein